MLWFKLRKLKDSTHRPQHIRDYDLSALEEHYLFWDYLEIGKIYLSRYSCSFINKIRTQSFVLAIRADYFVFIELKTKALLFYWHQLDEPLHNATLGTVAVVGRGAGVGRLREAVDWYQSCGGFFRKVVLTGVRHFNFLKR